MNEERMRERLNELIRSCGERDSKKGKDRKSEKNRNALRKRESGKKERREDIVFSIS